MKIPFYIAASLLICGCVTTDAVKVDFEKTKNTDMSFDQSWDIAVRFFAENNIPIQTLEKDSGIIAAEMEYLDSTDLSEFADCDSMSGEGNIIAKGVFNIFVTESTPGANIQINTKFTKSYVDVVWTGRRMNAACYSKGVLEARLLSLF